MSCSLTIKNITYKNEEKTLFENISFSVGHKEKIAVIGANGAGKSSLLKIIAGIEFDYEGELEIFHNLIKNKKEYEKYRSDIGYLPQDVSDYFLCPTVIEDVMFNLRAKGIAENEAYHEATLLLKQFKIEHLKDRSIFDLSGGEQKIVALCSILISKPKIILLDEPTNALDEDAQEKIIEILKGIEKSMIIISHHKSFIDKLAPTIYKLKDKEFIKV